MVELVRCVYSVDLFEGRVERSDERFEVKFKRGKKAKVVTRFWDETTRRIELTLVETEMNVGRSLPCGNYFSGMLSSRCPVDISWRC